MSAFDMHRQQCVCLQVPICQGQPEPLVADQWEAKSPLLATWKLAVYWQSRVSMGRRLRCSHASPPLGER